HARYDRAHEARERLAKLRRDEQHGRFPAELLSLRRFGETALHAFGEARLQTGRRRAVACKRVREQLLELGLERDDGPLAPHASDVLHDLPAERDAYMRL